MNKCPFHTSDEFWTSIPTVQASKIFRSGQYILPIENRSQQYANFAIAFDRFAEWNNNSLIEEIDALYDPWISRYNYMTRIREKLYEEIMMIPFGKSLNNGMSTFFLIINWIFHSCSTISKDEMFQKILYLMWSIQRTSLPSSSETDIEWSYKNYVALLLQDIPPLGYTKTSEEKRTQIPCPMIFTENGKKLINDILWCIYKHFPV